MWRARACLVVLAACSHAPPPPSAAPIANATRSCSDAAAGLERSTKSVRAPDLSVLQAMRERCAADAWSAAAIDCFASMQEGELGTCARQLPEQARDAMFGVLGGGEQTRTTIALARARLETLQVGVAECDRFVTAVHAVLACEGMPVEARAQLGAETADFWDLPTQGLSPDAQHRMADVCGASLRELEHQATGAGCAAAP